MTFVYRYTLSYYKVPPSDWSTDLLELLVREAVELDDELAVRGGDLGAGVDDLDDVQLLPQAHLRAHLPAQELDVLHLGSHTHNLLVRLHYH